MKHRFLYRFFAAVMALMMIGLSASGIAEETQNTAREFKDLLIYKPYDYLNSEITGDYDEAHAVKCVNGTFVGTEENGVASWLGIPFAKPPVGERRFKAPEYVDASDRVFEARYYGKNAMGATGPGGDGDCVQKLSSEDCLYLNIWVNADDKTEKKPVMVWIHGGAYVVGSGSEASYSGANLVQKQSDIILVNINYRLNMYGFMDFSSVSGGEAFKTAPCNGLLAEQYKAVLPLLDCYQFMDNYFTPHYLLDIVAARK